MKDKFIKAYTENITRPGADKLLAWIESSDFFTAPASTRFHLSSPAVCWSTASMCLSG